MFGTTRERTVYVALVQHTRGACQVSNRTLTTSLPWGRDPRAINGAEDREHLGWVLYSYRPATDELELSNVFAVDGGPCHVCWHHTWEALGRADGALIKELARELLAAEQAKETR